MSVSLVNDGTALNSMRDSDFDTYSAIGEVIDNSLQANAENVQIKIGFNIPDKKNAFQPITSIVFADDGDGMPIDILHRCLQLGYSSRYNDRTGIGRFGVGATLAAIHECQRVEIYSKQKGGIWQYTYIDLAEVSANPPTMVEIPEPIKKDLPEDYKSLTSDDKGTVVIWTKIDRQQESASKLIEELHIWVGRTFRKFIWMGINIYINGDDVKAIDPLYATTEKTKFPTDPKAHVYTPISFDYPISRLDRSNDSPEESEITIRLSLLPEEFRPNQGSANLNSNLQRHIHLNEGISIMRNDREVFYGHIPYWGAGGFKEKDRWWGCEIAFDATLDRAFTVRNIKRGAVPVKELKELIRSKIKPTIETAIESVDEVWNNFKQENEKNKAAKENEHTEAEKAAKSTPAPENVIDKDKDIDEESRKIAEDLAEDANEQQKALWETKFKSQPFTVIDTNWKGSDFIETGHLGGADVLRYNNMHPFFQELKNIKEEIEKSGKNIETAKQIITLIDLLLMSFSKAEAMFEKGEKLSTENFSENLKMQWGNYLSSYIKTLRENRQE